MMWTFLNIPDGPATTCKQCNRLLIGEAPYLCDDCLERIRLPKRLARRVRKRAKQEAGCR